MRVFGPLGLKTSIHGAAFPLITGVYDYMLPQPWATGPWQRSEQNMIASHPFGVGVVAHMSLRIFDTQLQDKIEFTPIVPGKIGIYVCGVTVYDMCHIGHARCYVSFDTIIRYLRYLGNDVHYVRNYTDVDDKIVKRAGELGEDIRTLTERFIGEFERDMSSLDVASADIEPKVTEHIPEIIAMVESLIERDHAYESQGDVYFAVDSFDEYGTLSKRNLEDLRAGASERTQTAESQRKRNPLDFALWKRSESPDTPSWESPWGQGRPGWHIECSAMSTRYLGTDFDLHAGGQDLIFPHHENEIAQSVCSHGGRFCRHWLHNGFVNIDSEKMSKSLGNFFTIRDVLQLFHPQCLRFFLLTTHYRGPINYSDTNLREATRRIYSVYATLERIDEYLEQRRENHKQGPVMDATLLDGIVPGFEAAMNDDFNTPLAIGNLSEPIRWANQLLDGKEKGGRYATLERLRAELRTVCDVLCVFHHDPKTVMNEVQGLLVAERGINPGDIDQKINDRAEARANRDFAAADAIRDELLAQNILIMDRPGGTSWRIEP